MTIVFLYQDALQSIWFLFTCCIDQQAKNEVFSVLEHSSTLKASMHIELLLPAYWIVITCWAVLLLGFSFFSFWEVDVEAAALWAALLASTAGT